jgi:hypothetical protein
LIVFDRLQVIADDMDGWDVTQQSSLNESTAKKRQFEMEDAANNPSFNESNSKKRHFEMDTTGEPSKHRNTVLNEEFEEL